MSSFKTRVQSALNASFKRDTFGQFLQEEFEKSLEDLTGNVGFTIQLLQVVELADREGWLHRLVISAHKKRPLDSELAKLNQEVAPLVTSATPYYDVLVFGDRPLIDRDDLRKVVESFELGPKSRVLVVHGDPKTGKSRTYWYLRHIQERVKKFDLIWIDFEDFTEEPVIDNRVLARAINDQLKLGFSFAETAADDAFKNQPFSNVFYSEIGQREQILVLVLDSFSKVSIDKSAYDLVNLLALKVETQMTNAFLVLLDFDQELPSKVNEHVNREQTAVVKKQHLALFLTEVLKASAGKTPPEREVARAMQEVLGGIDLSKAKTMKDLGDRCRDWVAKVKTGQWTYV